ncbi:MAG: hypothetical protein HWE14_06105 [Flavobacteriia bacterium]|nr:hypothetical protein [Flavobacteriia bacterium]
MTKAIRIAGLVAVSIALFSCNIRHKEGGPCDYNSADVAVYDADTAIYMINAPVNMHPWLANGLSKDVTDMLSEYDINELRESQKDTLPATLQVITEGTCTPIQLSLK